MVQILQVTKAKANTLAEFPIVGGKKMSFYLVGFTQNSKKPSHPYPDPRFSGKTKLYRCALKNRLLLTG